MHRYPDNGACTVTRGAPLSGVIGYDNQLNGESSMSIIDGEKSTSMSKDQQRLPDVVSTDVGIPTATIQLPMSIPAVEKSTSTLFPCLLK
jgi:hypothetical protein